MTATAETAHVEIGDGFVHSRGVYLKGFVGLNP